MTAPKRLVYGKPWALKESELDAIRANVETWQPKGSAIPMDLPEDDNEPEIANGVAVIDVCGVIVKTKSLIDEIFGGVVATTDVKEAFDVALASDVSTIIFKYDTGGGSVSGVPELASYIFEQRQNTDKQIISFVDGCACSAGYWLAAQAEAVFCTEASELANIGVIAAVYDFSRYIKNAGIDPYVFRSDEVKGAGGDGYQDAHGRAIMEQVVTFNKMFREAVARGRGISVEQLNSIAPDARIFIGQDSVDAGIADEVSTWDEVLARYSR